MNKFLAIEAFAGVVEHGGFTAAADKLGMSISTMTKSIARLESELGVQLLNRSTRRLSLTEYGQEFYGRVCNILSDLEDAETCVREGSKLPRGRIRISVPFSFGRVTLLPLLPEFQDRYPDIDLELCFSDFPLDPIEHRFDLVVHVGELPDSMLVSRLLTRGPQLTVASPAYLAARGTPQTPEELRQHSCIVSRTGPKWIFGMPDGSESVVTVPDKLIINNGDALREACVIGLGITRGTWWLFRKDLQSGRLKTILDAYSLEGAPISIIYPAKRHLPQKIRVLIDFLVEAIKDETGAGNMQHESVRPPVLVGAVSRQRGSAILPP